MKLTQNNLTNFFEIANESNSHYKAPHNTYDFISRKSKTLCVTVGESWTWGSDLPDRINDVYGNTLSKKLDADWLNLGLPGVGNHFISHKVRELDQIDLEYDDVYVFCTFTEIGRQLDSQYDSHIDFAQWKQSQNNLDFNNFLLMLNQDCLSIINSTKFNTIVGTNFVESLGFESETWLRLLMDYPDKCYSSMHGLDNLIKQIPLLLPLDKHELDEFKNWSCNMLDAGKLRDKQLKEPGMKNFHPSSKELHDVWANYLFNKL